MKRRNSITIALPASMIAEANHLREKTSILGQVGRAAAIYRVDQIIIYRNKPDESLLMKYILGYLETPQYLRKYLFDVRSELRYAGILPPLRTLHHPIQDKLSQVKVGEFREGIVVGGAEYNYQVDVGLEILMNVRGKPPKKGTRITTEILQKIPKFSGKSIKKKEIPDYWGYDLRGHNRGLSDLINNPEWDLTIATSRRGNEFSKVKDKLEVEWPKMEKTLIVFGSYREGIGEIISHEGKSAEEIFNYVVNTIPSQGTNTIRTEEAVISTLAILNTFKD